MVRVRFWDLKHFVPSIRPADPHQQIVFSGEMRSDVTLAFAPVLPADEHIDEPQILATVEAEMRSCSDDDIVLRATISLDYNVGNRCEGLDLPFGFVF